MVFSSNSHFSSKTELKERRPLAPNGSAQLGSGNFPGKVAEKQGFSGNPLAATGGMLLLGAFWCRFGSFDSDLSHACDLGRRRFLCFNGGVVRVLLSHEHRTGT